MVRVAIVTAGAGIHGGDKDEIGGVGGMLVGTGKSDLSVVERVAEGLEDVAGVFG